MSGQQEQGSLFHATAPVAQPDPDAEGGAALDEKLDAPEPKQPPLSAEEFRVYNQMAEKMDTFHNHFRHTWTVLHEACSSGKRPARTSLRQFLDEGINFCNMLTGHHDVEEAYFFPMLARRMPEFQKPLSGTKANKAPKPSVPSTAAAFPWLAAAEAKRSVLVQQHREIHAGMDLLLEWLRQCRRGETEFDMAVMRDKMDSWGDVLWAHLDEEVKTLGAENMRRYWTVDEMRSMLI